MEPLLVKEIIEIARVALVGICVTYGGCEVRSSFTQLLHSSYGNR